MFDLTGKRALVTGASGGIGREIARALGKAGARVALSGTRVAALEDTAREMGGGEHPILPCNLGNQDEVDKLVPSAESALGGLDILVNNAGMTRDNLFMRMKNEEWDEVLAVNLTAARAGTVPVFLVGFITSEGLYFAKLCAAATMAALPVVVAGWIAQNKLVQGLSFGAVK